MDELITYLKLSYLNAEKNAMRRIEHPARQLFLSAKRKGTTGQMISRLSGQPRQLLDLNEYRRRVRRAGIHYAGIRTVKIDHIRGSEGRTEDFDHTFYPLHSNNKDRWLGVARAFLMGESLPPVELILLGEVYFVRDGHHRISVARAIGQEAIEAEVVIWKTDPAVPVSEKRSS